MKWQWVIGIGISVIVVGIITDCSVGKTQSYSANVVDKIYKPAWTDFYTTTDSEGRTSFHTVHHPEQWRIVCQDSDSDAMFNVEVTQNKYHQYTNNQNVTVSCRVGRFTKINYLPSIVWP